MSSSVHKSYPDLVDLLQQRGMIVTDTERAQRKLSQIGYYRLSGYWYPCRKGETDESGHYVHDQKTGLPVRKDEFQDGISFDAITDLYLFDKKLRQLMLDALERIEIHIRTVIAHEMGYYDELAYQKDSFLNPKQLKERPTSGGGTTSNWNEWDGRQKHLIAQSKEECILHHKKNGRDIPFWVVVETWDFGLLATYYANLKDTFKNKICTRLEIVDEQGNPNKKILAGWLQELNILRNHCAHHSRIWNRVSSVHIGTLNDPYFKALHLSQDAKNRIYGKICVLWFLVQKIGPASSWLERMADLVDSKPVVECLPFTAMGFPDNSGFPRDKFNL